MRFKIQQKYKIESFEIQDSTKNTKWKALRFKIQQKYKMESFAIFDSTKNTKWKV